MPAREIKKLAVTLSICFSLLLLAAAFVASALFKPVQGAATLVSLPARHTQASIVQTGAGDEVLSPLDPAQEDVLNAKGDLAPSEMLALDDTLDTLHAISPTPKTLPNRAPAQAALVPAATTPVEPPVVTEKAPLLLRNPDVHHNLPAPTHARPNRIADLRRQSTLRLHWDAVATAARYHVRAWQFLQNRQVVLLDETLDQTEILLEPAYPGNIYWQVSGVDSAGMPGQAAGPLTVETLTKPPHLRQPASKLAK